MTWDWIDCGDELPPFDTTVLGWFEDGAWRCDLGQSLVGLTWYAHIPDTEDDGVAVVWPTHWCHIEPPKGETK